VLAHINITERKRAEVALHDSELRYRRLFEAAKDGVLILDAETGMVVDVNPFLIELLGLSREQFLQKKVWNLDSSRTSSPIRPTSWNCSRRDTSAMRTCRSKPPTGDRAMSSSSATSISWTTRR